MNIRYPLLLDGGLSNELEKAGFNLNHKLWTARLLDEYPEAIIQVHLAYLAAGARCITTSSYQASLPGFLASGHNKLQSEKLLQKTVLLAEEAIKRIMKSGQIKLKPLIAASIGPYGAFLADGSEYRGNYGVSDETLKAFHLPRIQLLDRTKADLFACETIPGFQEARVLADILKHTKKQAWVSFSCKDEHQLHDGTPIGECAAFFAKHPNVFAIGVNCTAPKYISGLIRSIKKSSGTKKIVVYPNSGEVYDAQSKTWSDSSDPDLFVSLAKEWLRLGADIVGGCCRIGPEHIKATLEATLF